MALFGWTSNFSYQGKKFDRIGRCPECWERDFDINKILFRQQMSPFYPFRGGGRPNGTMAPLFYQFFLTGASFTWQWKSRSEGPFRRCSQEDPWNFYRVIWIYPRNQKKVDLNRFCDIFKSQNLVGSPSSPTPTNGLQPEVGPPGGAPKLLVHIE